MEKQRIMEEQKIAEWIGMKGRIVAWYLVTPLRSLSDRFLGNIKSTFLNEIFHLIQGNEIILDAGAGSGYFSLIIAEKLTSGKLICLDLSEEMLYKLKKRTAQKGLDEKIQAIKGRASSVPIKNKSIDLAVSNAVFHELSNPDSVLGEIIRILKPGGRVIITDFRDTQLGRRMGMHRDGAHGAFSINELKFLLIKTGFIDVKISALKHWIIGIGKKPI